MITFVEFDKIVNEENLKDIKNLKFDTQWAYDEYVDYVGDSVEKQNMDVNECLRLVILDHYNFLLNRDFNKYELEGEL